MSREDVAVEEGVCVESAERMDSVWRERERANLTRGAGGSSELRQERSTSRGSVRAALSPSAALARDEPPRARAPAQSACLWTSSDTRKCGAGAKSLI
eukprot:2947451-Rhodomonas_salina.1